jgi:hypothetical protein
MGARAGCRDACLLFLSIAKAGAANFSTLKTSDGSDFVFVSGDLIVGDSQRFEKIVRLKAKVVVFFDSDGGSVLEGLSIGEIIRLKGLATVVANDSRCASSCALAWLGGIKRYAGSQSKIGFHAAYSEQTMRESGVANALIGAYLNKIGLGYEAVTYITSPALHEMQWLNFNAASQLKIHFEYTEVKIADLRWLGCCRFHGHRV